MRNRAQAAHCFSASLVASHAGSLKVSASQACGNEPSRESVARSGGIDHGNTWRWYYTGKFWPIDIAAICAQLYDHRFGPMCAQCLSRKIRLFFPG